MFRVCFWVDFVLISDSKFTSLGLQIQGVRKEGIVKTNFSQKSFVMNFRVDFSGFLWGLGIRFSVFLFLENKLKSDAFLMIKRISSLGSGGGDLTGFGL